MTFSDADRRFMERRRDRTSIGLYVLPALLLSLLGGWIGLFRWWPLAINPMHAAIHYEGMMIEKGTVTTYAITSAVLLNALFLILALALVFALLWARSERRYLKLLAKLERRDGTRAELAVNAEATRPPPARQ